MSLENKTARFFSLFMTHQHQLFSYLLMMVHNYTDAEDLIQEVAIILWEKFDHYDPQRSFLAWSIGVSRNVVLRFREANRRQRMVLDDQVYAFLDRYAQRGSGDTEERLDALRTCVSKLKPKDRELVSLHYVDRLPIKTIAQQIERSRYGLYQSFSRIHNLLQACVERKLKVTGSTT
ncbi:sigma-70 family RNA polymerase sigma factor [Planctomycetota bacterium]